MAAHGGKRPGAGRKRGKVSVAKRELSAMAKDHAEQALAVLVEIATQGEGEGSRVSAAVAILDRAYGKPVLAQVEGGGADKVADALNSIADKLPG